MLKEDIICPESFLKLSHNSIQRNYEDYHGAAKIHISTKQEEWKLLSNKNIFFVKTDYLDYFEQHFLPKIKIPFVLITHDSDCSITGNTNTQQTILNSPYLIKWFGMNCHTLHPKLHSIPIGMADYVWPHGDKDALIKIINKNNIKINLVYSNFDINTNITERLYATNILAKKDFIDFEKQKLNYNDYLEKLSTYKYVISPPGNSTDCHRIWEAIWLGVIPICLKSIPLLEYKDLPILFINDWNDITENLLNTSYDIIIKRKSEKANFSYYKKLILEAAKTV
jgi:hypothetical protein